MKIVSKPRYEVLDGLRGVAALMVIFYHIGEAYALNNPIEQQVNHGYLAVDFFFVLSGFVISYAYDDRWTNMSTAQFFRRRLIRLHPMVIAGVLIGLICYLVQGAETWQGNKVATSAIMLATLLTLFLIPTPPATMPEIRGNGEMFPLNGPLWSLFFEYIGNICYALFIRRLSTRMLCVLTALMGLALCYFCFPPISEYGHLGVGWTMADNGFAGGLLRMLFAYSLGMLVARKYRPVVVKHAFWKASFIIVIVLSMPYVGNFDVRWTNALYDILCITLLFPFIVWFAAAGELKNAVSRKTCQFLGEISYPVYVVHYPFMYLYYNYVWKHQMPFSQSWPIALAVVLTSIAVAWILLRIYDQPLRRRLSRM